MTFLSWRDDYSVGVDVIDAEHRYLFELITEFHDRHARGEAREDVARVLNRLVAYAEQHFQNEEGLMRKSAYPGLEGQLAQHEQLFYSVFALNDKVAKGALNVDTDILRFLKGWLVGHIVKEDMQLGDFLQRRAARLKKMASAPQGQAAPADDSGAA
jgi:hemerythrin